MTDESLKRVLREADAAAGDGPRVGDDLARRVRSLDARRRNVRFRFNVAAAAVIAVGSSLLFSESPRLSSRAGPEPTTERNAIAELERLDREADSCLAVVLRTQEILGQRERLRTATKRCEVLEARGLAIPDVVLDARREVDTAARTVVAQADRMCRKMDLCGAAVVRYQWVIDLFPDSRWATVARQRIDEIKQKGELS